MLNDLISETLATKNWITEKILESRAKDYTNEFRKMAYDTQEEMNNVVGALKNNSFINQQQEELKSFTEKIILIKKKLKLK